MVYLWWAVDHEGEILRSFVTKTRDKAAVLPLRKKMLKRVACAPEAIATDGPRSYKAAMTEVRIEAISIAATAIFWLPQ